MSEPGDLHHGARHSSTLSSEPVVLAIPTGTSTRCSPSSTRTLQTFPESSEMATGQYPGACWTRTPGYWLYRSEASDDQILCLADPTQRPHRIVVSPARANRSAFVNWAVLKARGSCESRLSRMRRGSGCRFRQPSPICHNSRAPTARLPS